ncbi:MAG: hypothetical protein K9G60_16205, partial [Pseudolabrys sp.]|nr:hypothetical protein [Pseudolabrys sp.]
ASATQIRRKSPALPAKINRLFTANGKKSVGGLRTGPHPIAVNARWFYESRFGLFAPPPRLWV